MSVSRLRSTVKLYSQATIDEGFGDGPIEHWEQMAPGKSYQGYWIYLFDESGDVLPWSASGVPVELPAHYSDGSGTKEWYVHLAGGLPGIFELARFDDPFAVDAPTDVQQFEFDGHVIGPLPLVEYDNVGGETGPVPAQAWRFWPGKYAELIPA